MIDTPERIEQATFPEAWWRWKSAIVELNVIPVEPAMHAQKVPPDTDSVYINAGTMLTAARDSTIAKPATTSAPYHRVVQLNRCRGECGSRWGG